MIAQENRPLDVLGKIARAFACLGLAYWGIYALVTPVTNVDSQIYNLARVELADRGGLFGNPSWTSVLQVVFPWTYDALHWPFLRIGFGYALPSYFCFLGTCLIVFQMVRPRFGLTAAWAAINGLLALPCLVYQATSTKNDIPLVFCAAIWLYGRWRWRRDAQKSHLFWMALAIGFMVGSKTTGLIYGALLLPLTLFELRQSRRLQITVMGWAAAALLLFGSIETAWESNRLFGHPLGPPQIVRDHRNCEGFRGGAANLSRYIMGSVYVGQSNWRPSRNAIAKLASTERNLLEWASLTDAGIKASSPDRKLFFFQSGMEELSGFGPLGTVGIAIMFAACFRWRPNVTWWQLSALAAFGLALASMTFAYMMWNNRFLIGHFTLTTVACVCLLWQEDTRWRRLLRWGFVTLAITCATAAPLVSFNRGPSSLIAALIDRQQFETCVLPIIGKIRTRLHDLRTLGAQGRIVFAYGRNPEVLPYLTDSALRISLVPVERLAEVLSSRMLVEGDIVFMESECASPLLIEVDTVTAPNMTNGAANGAMPPLVCHIYRVR